MTASMYNGRVRDRSPDTSWSAADRQTDEKVSEIKSTIAVLLATRGPMTDEQLVDAYTEYASNRPWLRRVTPQSIRTRRHEMKVAAQVRFAGSRRPTEAGGTAAVWELVAVGEADEATA